MTWKRTDRNQNEIVKLLRKSGARVFVTSDVGKGFTDLVVSIHGQLWLVEVKDGDKPKSGQKLTPQEAEFHRQWAPHVVIINSIDAAIQWMNSLATGDANECRCVEKIEKPN